MLKQRGWGIAKRMEKVFISNSLEWKIHFMKGGADVMTVKECYEAFGGDYEGVLQRMWDEKRVEKFVLRFLDDPSYDMLKKALEVKNMHEAFRGAHTLKGVAQSLGITPLYETGSELADLLRDEQEHDTAALMEKLDAEYKEVCAAITILKNER